MPIWLAFSLYQSTVLFPSFFHFTCHLAKYPLLSIYTRLLICMANFWIFFCTHINARPYLGTPFLSQHSVYYPRTFTVPYYFFHTEPCLRSRLARRSSSADNFFPSALFSTVFRRSKLRSLALTSRTNVLFFTLCSRRFASRSFRSISNLVHTHTIEILKTLNQSLA